MIFGNTNAKRFPGRVIGIHHNRCGAALMEFTVCLPVLVLIVLGSIEATSAVFVRQGVVVAAYEGIREAVRRDGTVADAIARTNDILNQRNIKSATVRFTPADFTTVPRGGEVTVQIVADMKANSPFFGAILKNRQVNVSTTMVRE